MLAINVNVFLSKQNIPLNVTWVLNDQDELQAQYSIRVSVQNTRWLVDMFWFHILIAFLSFLVEGQICSKSYKEKDINERALYKLLYPNSAKGLRLANRYFKI